MGNIDELDPETLSIIVDAQNLAKQYGIGTGKGLIDSGHSTTEIQHLYVL